LPKGQFSDTSLFENFVIPVTYHYNLK